MAHTMKMSLDKEVCSQKKAQFCQNVENCSVALCVSDKESMCANNRMA